MEAKPIEQLEVVKTEETKTEESPLNKFQQEALKDAEEKLEKMQKDFQAQKYLVDIPKVDIEMLGKFIDKDAPWKFTECLGIKEIEKELIPCIKKGKLFITAIAVEAIYYYLSKVEGFGNGVFVNGTETEAFNSVEEYLRLLKPITSTIERIKADGEKIKQASFIVAARREGIEPDSSIEENEQV